MAFFYLRIALTLFCTLGRGRRSPWQLQDYRPRRRRGDVSILLSGPHDPNTVLLNCDMTGAYISHDGGKSWRMFNLRGVVEFFVFDPRDKNTILCRGQRFYGAVRTTEKTWNLVLSEAGVAEERQDELRPFR